eukprot:564624-Rhodomonas_salina.3
MRALPRSQLALPRHARPQAAGRSQSDSGTDTWDAISIVAQRFLANCWSCWALAWSVVAFILWQSSC